MPTLIERQTKCIAALAQHCAYEANASKGKSANTNYAARLKRLHAEELMRAGYAKAQAWASAKDCYDMARLEALCDYAEGKHHAP
jgi:hypothetical protein